MAVTVPVVRGEHLLKIEWHGRAQVALPQVTLKEQSDGRARRVLRVDPCGARRAGDTQSGQVAGRALAAATGEASGSCWPRPGPGARES